MSDDEIREWLRMSKLMAVKNMPSDKDGVVLVRLSVVEAVCEEVLRLRQEVATLRAERDAAVAAERERCAEVADLACRVSSIRDVCDYGDVVAAAIRRGE